MKMFAIFRAAMASAVVFGGIASALEADKALDANVVLVRQADGVTTTMCATELSTIITTITEYTTVTPSGSQATSVNTATAAASTSIAESTTVVTLPSTSTIVSTVLVLPASSSSFILVPAFSTSFTPNVPTFTVTYSGSSTGPANVFPTPPSVTSPGYNTTSAQGPATSAQGPATSAQGPATSAQGPATSAQGPATSAQGPPMSVPVVSSSMPASLIEAQPTTSPIWRNTTLYPTTPATSSATAPYYVPGNSTGIQGTGARGTGSPQPSASTTGYISEGSANGAVSLCALVLSLGLAILLL